MVIPDYLDLHLVMVLILTEVLLCFQCFVSFTHLEELYELAIYKFSVDRILTGLEHRCTHAYL